MPESAFAVNVPEAEPYVRELRERFDPSAKLGVPAHITLLYPFFSPELITDTVLRKVRQAFTGAGVFAFRLTKIDNFATAMYLTPEPSEPFIALTQRLVGHFPAHLPYGGQYSAIVPHLTVARGDYDRDLVEGRLRGTLPAHGIEASCNEVVLIENSSGTWKHMHSFPLAAPSELAGSNG